jgi:hypothetical protein
MLADEPCIAGPSHRLGWCLRDLFLRISVGCRAFGIGQQHGKFVAAEAQPPEVDLAVPEFGEFRGECLVFPSGQFGQLVVGQQIGALLYFGEVIQDNDGHRFEPQLEGGQVPAMSGDDIAP